MTEATILLALENDGIARKVVDVTKISQDELTELRAQFSLQLSGPPRIVSFLLKRARNTQFNERREREAFPIHDECFSVFKRLLKCDFPDRNAIKTAWTIAQSMCPSWDSLTHPYEQRRRRRAILRDAAGRGHFSTLGAIFKAYDPVTADLFHRIHHLPTELRQNIVAYLEHEAIHISLVIMQQTSDFVPILGMSEYPSLTRLDLLRDLHIQSGRVAGRDYILRVENQHFPGAEQLRTPPGSLNLTIQFDDFGIISLQYITSNSLVDCVKKQDPPCQTWYQTIELINEDTEAIVVERKVSTAFCNFYAKFRIGGGSVRHLPRFPEQRHHFRVQFGLLDPNLTASGCSLMAMHSTGGFGGFDGL